jgi:SAM-dependent methyltransferase
MSDLSRQAFDGVTKAATIVAAVTPGGIYECPACHFQGRFASVFASTGRRRHARCPRCGALERHRLQVVTLRNLLPQLEGTRRRVLHVAPEGAVASALSEWATTYTTADIEGNNVDLTLDLRDMSAVPDESYDLIWASHVFEHIDRDREAINEVRRVLARGGCAVLPVPIVADHTVEYPAPSPFEAMHVRAPGADYCDRYREVFDRVEIMGSEDAPPSCQPWIYENRLRFPTKHAPHRPPQQGKRHRDLVPICWRDAERS